MWQSWWESVSGGVLRSPVPEGSSRLGAAGRVWYASGGGLQNRPLNFDSTVTTQSREKRRRVTGAAMDERAIQTNSRLVFCPADTQPLRAPP